MYISTKRRYFFNQSCLNTPNFIGSAGRIRTQIKINDLQLLLQIVRKTYGVKVAAAIFNNMRSYFCDDNIYLYLI